MPIGKYPEGGGGGDPRLTSSTCLGTWLRLPGPAGVSNLEIRGRSDPVSHVIEYVAWRLEPFHVSISTSADSRTADLTTASTFNC